MGQHQIIVYVGDDDRFFGALQGQLESRGYKLKRSMEPELLMEEWVPDWYRLLVLDADLTTCRGLDLLHSVRMNHEGIPAIVVADSENLTNISLARLNGSEALFFKPVTDFRPLLEAVQRAFSRLDHWQQMLEEYTQRT